MVGTRVVAGQGVTEALLLLAVLLLAVLLPAAVAVVTVVAVRLVVLEFLGCVLVYAGGAAVVITEVRASVRLSAALAAHAKGASSSRHSICVVPVCDTYARSVWHQKKKGLFSCLARAVLLRVVDLARSSMLNTQPACPGRRK